VSNALAIAGVTAVLQHYLYNMYSSEPVAQNFPSPVRVSCLAPDQVQQQLQSGQSNAENQVNLFLHLVTPNAAWRNIGYPSLNSAGNAAITNPPLALDLHYLLTVYGSDPWQAEALLGFALMMLHVAPVLTRQEITTALAARQTSHYPALGYQLNQTLGGCGIGDQAEMLKITPESMSREEMAWLWTALKADYRPTYPFQVSVALMKPDQTASFALPVLKTVLHGTATPPATISAIQTATGQPAAQQGDSVTVIGEFLSGANNIQLTHTRLGTVLGTPLAPIVPTGVTATSLTFQLPPLSTPPSAGYPAGVYDLAVQFLDTAHPGRTLATNTLPLEVAPTLPSTQTATSAPSVPSGTDTVLTISSLVAVWPGQSVTLGLSNALQISGPGATLVNLSADMQQPVHPSTNPVSSLSFPFNGTVPSGKWLARLQVDGVSSVVLANIPKLPQTGPPSFTGPTVTTP
jgi:Pvc16 N-terminal domain